MRTKLDPLAIVSDWITGNPYLCSISFGGGGGGGSKQQSSQRSGTQWRNAQRFLSGVSGAFPFPTYSNDLESGEMRVTDQPVPVPKQRKMQAVLDEEGNPVIGPDGVPLTEPVPGQQAGKVPWPEHFKAQQFQFGVPRFRGLEDMDFDRLESSLFERQKGLLDPEFERSRSRTQEELSQMGLGTSPVAYSEGGALDVLEDERSQAYGRAATEATIATTELKQQELARKLGFDFDLLKYFEEIFNSRIAAALNAGKFGTGSSSGSATNNPSFGFSIGNIAGSGSNSGGSGV